MDSLDGRGESSRSPSGLTTKIHLACDTHGFPLAIMLSPGENVIERLFSWPKEKRRICTRYDKLASSFKAMATLACIERCLRTDFSDKP